MDGCVMRPCMRLPLVREPRHACRPEEDDGDEMGSVRRNANARSSGSSVLWRGNGQQQQRELCAFMAIWLFGRTKGIDGLSRALLLLLLLLAWMEPLTRDGRTHGFIPSSSSTVRFPTWHGSQSQTEAIAHRQWPSSRACQTHAS